MTAELMTLTQLAEAAGRVVSGVDQASGRVREVPDVRTIRYYTTLGLIDRATEMRGRTAYYSERHLRQLVAIKRLQADGFTLEQVQERLVGLSSQGLRALATVPEGIVADVARAPQRPAFWKQPVVAAKAEREPALPTLQTVALAPGVLLTFELTEPVSAEDAQTLTEKAQAVLRWIEQKRST